MILTVPPEFIWLPGRRVSALVRHDMEDELKPLLTREPFVLPSGARPLSGGRGGTYWVPLDRGRAVIVRLYRRGGLLGRLLGERYRGWPPRPFAELAATEEARRRKVAVVEVLAARVERLTAGWYRGLLVTAEIRGAVDFYEALRQRPEARVRAAIAAAAGRAVRALHEAGVFHADLNSRNILVRQGRQGPEAVLIDFDRAWVGSRPLPVRARRLNIARLARSLAKLDPRGVLMDAAGWAAFNAAYAGAG